ncbi:hypothetical protein [uncultured Dokdonia sp.]|uniref:TapB family protein n=1 Tax=uncultured Dokdonia sp. TaxID=575653 RepID=UPI00261CDCEE|nr:hypothetical protein [uncultured Dokdonia sp.]
MKTLIIILIFCITTPLLAQNNCSKYYASTPGRKLIHKTYDKRDRHSLTTEYKIENITPSGINVTFNLWDKRDKHITGGELTLGCENRTTYLASESIMTDILSQYEGIEYTVTTTDRLAIPNNLQIGQTLPDASTSISVDAQIMAISFDINLSDRKVVRREQIETPAGTFDCYVITYTNQMAGGLGTRNYQSTDWIAEGIGMVKQETFKENGRLVSRSELTEVSDI